MYPRMEKHWWGKAIAGHQDIYVIGYVPKKIINGEE